MSLARKAMAAFGVVLVLSIAGAAAVVTLANAATSRIAGYRQHTAVLAGAIAAARADFYDYDDQLNAYVAVLVAEPGLGTLAELTYRQAAQARARLEADLGTAGRLAAVAHLQPDLARLRADVIGYDALAARVRAAGLAGQGRRAMQVLALGNLGPAKDLTAQLGVASTATAAAAATQLRSLQQSQRQVEVVAAVVASLTVVLLIGLWVAFQQAVLRPLAAVRQRLDEIADGEADLSARLPVHGEDELAELAAAFNRFVDGVSAVVVSVAASAQTLAAAAGDLTTSASAIGSNAAAASDQSLAVAGAAEQVAGNVSSVSAGAEQMGASIREIASNATEAARRGEDAAQVATRTEAEVSRLGEASAQIGGVVKVITSIAEQTNLLALNATIEAARAGEAGKGFAVVANEVKELAGETAKATEDISDRIADIQASVAAAAASITAITGTIAELGDYQTTIASAVEEQTATTQEMTRSVAEAAAGVTDIAANAAALADAAQRTNAGIDQVRAAVAGLAGTSEALRTLVGRFRT